MSEFIFGYDLNFVEYLLKVLTLFCWYEGLFLLQYEMQGLCYTLFGKQMNVRVHFVLALLVERAGSLLCDCTVESTEAVSHCEVPGISVRAVLSVEEVLISRTGREQHGYLWSW